MTVWAERGYPHRGRWFLLSILWLGLAGCAVPEPLTNEQVTARIAADREILAAELEPVTGPVSLEEAMARAVKHNLDYRLKVMETALSQGEADLTHWDLLPRMTANAGYTARNNENASNSRSLSTGVQSLENSTSTEKEFETASLSMAWNVLDFGVTYLRTKQQMDRKLVADERRRKVVQNIIQDVRYSYWKAVSAQRLLPRVEAFRTEVLRALENSRAALGRGLQPPIQALEYQMTLMDTLRQIGQLQRDLVLAKTEISTLMNLPPGTPFTLAPPLEAVEVPGIPKDIELLQGTALVNRPELREQDYQERIGVAETRKAILRMLPGLEMNADFQYNGNSYLYNQSWMEGGLKLSWNLISLASGPQQVKLAEAREELERKRRLALGMAVLTQVNVAYIRFRQAQEDFTLTRELFDLAGKLQAQTDTAVALRAENGQEAVRRLSRALFTELQRDAAYAELQNAAGRVFSSVGADPLPDTVTATDLPTLAAAIGHTLSNWERGEFVISGNGSAAYAPGSVYYLTQEAYVWAEPDADAPLSGMVDACLAVKSIAFKGGWHQLEPGAQPSQFSEGWVPAHYLASDRARCGGGGGGEGPGGVPRPVRKVGG
ncbi:MAG: TolC family protein, partial [Alphaproteobacteria bacterium]|nr:TolC family protein [Alphaproteobacteria bacterium]